MADYGNFCPVALGSEVVADRWTPLIVRELVLGSTRFNEIARGLPGISRSLLVQRLAHLERKGVIHRTPIAAGRGSEYHLTPAGRDLEPVLIALGSWAVRWLYQDLQPHDIDAVTLTWWMHRCVEADRLPMERVVLQFDHTAPERRSIWMVLDQGTASVCIQHPGFEPDLVITCTTGHLGEVFSGMQTWAAAVAEGTITVEGSPRLARSIPRWFAWSPFRPAVRDRLRELALTP